MAVLNQRGNLHLSGPRAGLGRVRSPLARLQPAATKKNGGHWHSCIAAFYVGLVGSLPENSSGVV